MGSVTSYETARGKRYRVRYRKPDHSQTDKRGFRTKRDAELFLASTEVSKARGEYIDASASRMAIGELGKIWLSSQTHLKPSAFEPLEIAWRLYVEPRWGASALSEVRFSDVQTWISQLTLGTATTKHAKPGPRSATVVLRAYGVLAAILDSAVRDRRLLANPARGVSLPRKVKRAHTYLSHEQVELLALQSRYHGTLIRLLAYSGLRWGEAIALRVRDVDALRRRLSIRENAVRVNGKIIIGTPKNHSARTVPLPDFLTLELARACESKGPESLLFGNGNDHLKQPAHRDGWFEVAIARAQEFDPTFVRLTPHDLRHTAASLAVSAGGNVKAIQRMLGHSSAAMTLDVYADLFDDDLETLGIALNAARARSDVGKMWANIPNDLVATAQIPHK
jgi:integrase